MKKLSFLLPVFLLFFFACNNDNKGPMNKDTNNKGMNRDNRDNPDIDNPAGSKKSVIGKWDVVEMNMGEMDTEEKEDAEKNASIEFRSDGTYTSVDSDDTDEGNYTYNKEERQLTITSDKHGPTNVTFSISWEGAKMIMSGEGGSVTLRRM